jgi:predicted nuclease of predicted toxin-antitoxin system
VKFLVDNALSPVVSDALQAAGHDSAHVRRRGLATAADEVLLDLAAEEQRVVISADTDFASLLAMRGARVPSVILFRHGAEHRPDEQARLLLANLSAIESALAEGSLVTIEPSRIRIRRLPVG